MKIELVGIFKCLLNVNPEYYLPCAASRVMNSFVSSPVKSASPSVFAPESQLCPLSLHLAQNQAQHGTDSS